MYDISNLVCMYSYNLLKRLLFFKNPANLRILLQFSEGFHEIMSTENLKMYLNKNEFNLVTSGHIQNFIDKELLISKFVYSGKLNNSL